MRPFGPPDSERANSKIHKSEDQEDDIITMTSEHPAAAQLKQSSEGHPCFHTPHHRRKEKNIFDYIIWHTTSQLTQKQMTTHLIGDVVVMFRLAPFFIFIVA